MPTYDYQCRSCGTVTEVIHAMTADGPTVCELCGGALRRVLYPAGIIFKGSGFYRTDSRATSDSGDGSSSASKASTTGTSSSGGDAAKPAATGGSTPASESSGSSESKGSAGSSGGESAS